MMLAGLIRFITIFITIENLLVPRYIVLLNLMLNLKN